MTSAIETIETSHKIAERLLRLEIIAAHMAAELRALGESTEEYDKYVEETPEL